MRNDPNLTERVKGLIKDRLVNGVDESMGTIVLILYVLDRRQKYDAVLQCRSMEQEQFLGAQAICCNLKFQLRKQNRARSGQGSESFHSRQGHWGVKKVLSQVIQSEKFVTDLFN